MIKYAFLPVSLIILLGVLYVGKPLLMPLVLAIFIWYMINILADAFTRPLPLIGVSMPRPLAFCAALAIIGGAIYFASWIIMSNVAGIAATLPAYQYNFEQMSRRLLSLISWGEPLTVGKLMSGVDLGAVTRKALLSITSFFGQGAIVSIYLIFLFMEQRSFQLKLVKLFPDPDRLRRVKRIIKRIDSDVRKYIGIKTIVSIVTALICYAIMASVGLKFASFWAFMVFVLNYIPTIGSIVATILPTMFALMQYDTLAPFLVVLIGVGVVEGTIGSVIEPRFQGDNLNLSPLVIVISLALWNMVWGIPGMFLCVPLTAIAMIIFSHVPQTRTIALALSRNGNLSCTAADAEAVVRPGAKTRLLLETKVMEAVSED